MLNDINLIPDKILYKRNNKIKGFLRNLLVFVLFLLLASALSFRTYQRWSMEKMVAQAAAGIDANLLDELSRAEDDLEKKKLENSVLDEIYKSIPGVKVKVTDIITDVTTLLPATIAVERINYYNEKAEINVDFLATSRQDISIFLKRIGDDPLYTNIKISDIKGDKGSFRFSIRARIVQN